MGMTELLLESPLEGELVALGEVNDPAFGSGAMGRGGAVKKREDTHRMADANKAFSHYRW